MGDSYGRRNFYRPTRQEWANSPQYYPTNMVDPFAMTGGAYGPPSMVRATNMGPPIIPNAFQHQSPFTLPPPSTSPNANMAFQPSIDNRGGFPTHETQFSNFSVNDGNSFAPQMHG